ncbi:MAG: DUF1295 domain-containing protein [Bdellovibrionota bacterium]|nr:MAG: DUF1295 domain-containing protein [Bdellovibrionota bacterium]
MSELGILGIGWVICAASMVALYFEALRRREADIVDAGRAGLLGLLAVVYCCLLNGYPPRKYLIAALMVLWALRLGAHLFKERVAVAGEDGRYADLRALWGENANRNFFIYFQAQGFLCVLLSLPLLVVMMNPVPCFTVWDTIGVGLWVLAVGGESVADAQLGAFKSNPANAGRVCDVGLWRYSRHPNYFFEWLHWISYAVLALGSANWWLAMLAPLTMLYLILKVTGIPPSEARALATKGDAYRDYQRRTSTFIPWFPGKP